MYLQQSVSTLTLLSPVPGSQSKNQFLKINDISASVDKGRFSVCFYEEEALVFPSGSVINVLLTWAPFILKA